MWSESTNLAPTLTNEGFIQLFAHFIVNKAGGLPSESLNYMHG